ncbi:unnamed protein product [Gordionus sp. m RMFG-2023]
MKSIHLTSIESANNNNTDIKYCRVQSNKILLYEHMFYGQIGPVLIILGIFGNCFNYYIFSESSKFNLGLYYMKMVALLDFCVCVLWIKNPVVNLAERNGWFIAVDFGHVWFQTNVVFILDNSLMKTSSLLILLICVERYLFIYKIDLHCKWKKSGWSKAMPWVCFLVSILLCIPQVLIYPVMHCFDKRLMLWRYSYDVRILRPNVYTLYTLAKEFVLTLLPLAIALWFNARLLRAFYKYYDGVKNTETHSSVATRITTKSFLSIKKLKKNNTVSQIPPQKFNIVKSKIVKSPIPTPIVNHVDTPAHEGRIKGRRMLVLLFSFVASYAFFILPISIMTVLYSFLFTHCQSEPCPYRILIYCFNTLEFCNYSLSFYLYLMVDSKFREIFKELLFCGF